MSDRHLIVGADGLLGSALRSFWMRTGKEVLGTRFLNVPQSEGTLFLDLSQPSTTWPPLPRCRAAVLCAAITSLDKCREDPQGTRTVNVTHTLELAKRLAADGAFVVFISSNLVFDGTRPMRKPEEPVCPVVEYGRQKTEVEAGLKAMGDRAAIVRLTKVFHRGMPVISHWLTALEEGRPIQPFNDFLCSPICLADTVRAIASVADRRESGVWQLSGSCDISYADMARHIAALRNMDGGLIQPVPARPSGKLDFLPAYTTLDASRAASRLGFPIRDPKEVMDLSLP